SVTHTICLGPASEGAGHGIDGRNSCACGIPGGDAILDIRRGWKGRVGARSSISAGREDTRMAETIRSTEDRTSPQLFRRLKSFFQRQRWPARLAFLIAASALAVFLAIIFFRYGSSVYNDWLERRLLHRAASMLQQEKFEQAAVTARAIVQLHRESLPAFSILAEATEKQNSEETVWWREQIARLLPTDPDSQLNLASAALRFGQLDVARKPWIASRLPITTEPPFMSSRAGWR